MKREQNQFYFFMTIKKKIKVVKCFRPQGDKVPCLIETPYYCACPRNLTPDNENQRCFGVSYKDILDWRKSYKRYDFIHGSCTKKILRS